MNTEPEWLVRAKGLETELLDAAKGARRRAKVDYWIAFLLTTGAVIGSVGVSIGGLAFDWSARTTALAALVPGMFALIASTMKFEGKSNWHYEKLYTIEALLARIRYQLPENPSVADVADVSKEHRAVIAKLNERWDKTLNFDWTGIKHPSTRPGANID